MTYVTLFRAITARSTSQMSNYNIPILLACASSPAISRSQAVTATFNASALYGYAQVLAGLVPYSYAIAAVAVLFDYLAIMAITPADIATRHSTHHRRTIKSAVNASPPVNCASNSAASPIFASQRLSSPNGSITEPTTRPA